MIHWAWIESCYEPVGYGAAFSKEHTNAPRCSVAKVSMRDALRDQMPFFVSERAGACSGL